MFLIDNIMSTGASNSMSKLQQITEIIPDGSIYILKKLAELQQQRSAIELEITEETDDCPSKVTSRSMSLNWIKERAIDRILSGNEVDLEILKEECSESCNKNKRILSLQTSLTAIEAQIASIESILG